MTSEQLEYGRQLAEKYYDIKLWHEDGTAFVHYWNDDKGDFYYDETLYDLLSSIAYIYDDVGEYVEYIF